jgi:hypothetical protein
MKKTKNIIIALVILSIIALSAIYINYESSNKSNEKAVYVPAYFGCYKSIYNEKDFNNLNQMLADKFGVVVRRCN